MAENRELALVLRLVADQFSAELRKQQSALGSFNSFISNWKTQLTAVGGAFFAIAKSTANYGEELLKTSQKVGINIQALAGLQHAANIADLSSEQLGKGLKFLSVNMAEAGRKTGDGGALFRSLGISATTATGQLRPTEEVLLDVADAFAKSKDGAGKTEMAVKLFGKAGLELIPFLNQGKTGIKALMEEAQRLGLVMSKEDAEAANKFNDELKKLNATMRGFVLEAGTPLLSVLTGLMETFRSLTGNVAVKFFFKGLAEEAAIFGGVLKELAADADFLFGKLSFDELKTKMKGIRAELSAQLLLLENPDAAKHLGGNTATPANDKGDITSLTDLEKQRKLEAEALQARYEAKKQAQDNEMELLRAGFERQRFMVDASLADGTASETRATEERINIKEQELLAEVEQIKAKRDLLMRFNAERTALVIQGSNNEKEERLKIETEYQKQFAELIQKTKLIREQLASNELKGEIDLTHAKSAEAKKQLDLFIQGANLMGADRQKQQSDLIANEQAWVNYYDELGVFGQEFYARKMDLLRANLAKELDLNQRQAATLLMAWQTNDAQRAESILANSPKNDAEKQTAQINALTQATKNLNETSDDFFAGWANGMKNYIKDTKSGFGLAADMARRTAQAMEQGFRTFFFDAMEGKIKGFKDLLKSVLDFAKQIISQIMAQMVMAGIAKSFAGGFGGAGPGAANFSGGNMAAIRGFASGGMGDFGRGSLAMLHGAEAVVPLDSGRSIPVTMKTMGSGSPSVSVPIHIEVINQVQGAKVETQQSTGADGMQHITMLIHQTVKSGFNSGMYDKDMNRFGNKPQPIGR